jgi:hypothetical protein
VQIHFADTVGIRGCSTYFLWESREPNIPVSLQRDSSPGIPPMGAEESFSKKGIENSTRPGYSGWMHL